MTQVSVRYIVDDLDEAAAFYRQQLGFLDRGGLRLLLSEPGGAGGAAQPMPDGRRPEPGGWNRIQLEVDDLAARIDVLRRGGARFRNDMVRGRGGAQILLDDPSGNPIELFEPASA